MLLEYAISLTQCSEDNPRPLRAEPYTYYMIALMPLPDPTTWEHMLHDPHDVAGHPKAHFSDWYREQLCGVTLPLVAMFILSFQHVVAPMGMGSAMVQAGYFGLLAIIMCTFGYEAMQGAGMSQSLCWPPLLLLALNWATRAATTSDSSAAAEAWLVRIRQFRVIRLAGATLVRPAPPSTACPGTATPSHHRPPTS